MAAGAVVLAATLQSLHHLQQRFWSQQATILGNQDVRIGLEIMESEFRQVGTAGASQNAVLRAEPQTVEFTANLASLETALTEPVSPWQLDLSVADGKDWPKDKKVVVCAQDRCAETKLARNGRANRLVLTGALGQAFPAGSVVRVSNHVRYYLGTDQSGGTSLMRMVDGGANPLIGNVRAFGLRYLDREGKITQDRARVARIRIELAVGPRAPAVSREVGLRGR